MSNRGIDLFFYRRPLFDEDLEKRHQELVKRMQEIGPPLGWRGLRVPSVPEFGEELIASFSVSYAIPGIQMYMDYSYRDKTYLAPEEAALDDKMSIRFLLSNKAIDYHDVVHRHFPVIAGAYEGYAAKLYFASYFVDYEDMHEEEYEAVSQREGIDVDGRNNIFTLHPAQYWDAELCGKALGFGPDEVIRRLDGQVPLVRPLMNGVYTVFNDDPDLSFEDFCAFNDRFKPVLGLV